MKESEISGENLDERRSPLHLLDIMEAEGQEEAIEEDIENALADGQTYTEIYNDLFGTMSVLEQVLGSEYARFFAEQMEAEELNRLYESEGELNG